MCNDCCCNTTCKNCYLVFVIFFSIFAIVFEIIIVALIDNSMNIQEIKDYILSETPLYNFEISTTDKANKKTITFFEYKGYKEKVGNTSVIKEAKNFTIIFGQKFLYEGKDKNYFDYKNKYSVSSNENCPSNHHQCGILNYKQRKLCLPDGEECPLNGFKIAETAIESPYICKEVYITKTYYMCYTNEDTSNNIITEFKLSLDPPCAKISEKNWESVFPDEVDADNYKCKTVINGKKFSERYEAVSDAIFDLPTLYDDNGISNNNLVNSKAKLFVKNYNDIDEECVQKFFEDLDDEDTYYDNVAKAVRALGVISLIFSLALIIFIIMICRCDFKYNLFAISVPIIGILVNIISLGIINKTKLRYKCELEGFNDTIDELLDKQYDMNNAVNIVMSAFSLAFFIIVFIFSLCLKFMKQRNSGIPVVVGVNPAVPGYQTPYPYNSNAPYQNMMQGPASYGVVYG